MDLMKVIRRVTRIVHFRVTCSKQHWKKQGIVKFRATRKVNTTASATGDTFGTLRIIAFQ